jgi:peptidoglycan hydrolase-like protein with peptidoglycan-binding domain
MKSRIAGLFVLASVFAGAFPAVSYAQYGGGGGPPMGVFGVFAPSPTTETATAPAGQVLGASVYNFTSNFGLGTQDEDVTQLQTILITGGYLKITAPSGYYGPLTKAAVEAYQAANNISPASGYVGPLTRAVLNKGVTPTAAQEQSSVLQNLYAELAKALKNLAALSSST